MTDDGRAADLAGRSLKVLAFLITVMLLTVLIVLQQRGSGAFSAEFSATNSDEASHYVTGLMLADYITAGFPSPLPFADTFYLHYPKVGIGHWPPLYYLAEGIWFLIFTPSTPAALLLPAVITALLVASAAWVTLRRLGPIPAVAVGAVLMTLPLLREATVVIMLDLPVALLALWAAFAYGRYLDEGRARHAVLFGVLASAAILTKGTGAGLALLPPLAVILGGRLDLLKRGTFWLPLPIVAVLAGPWTLGTYAMAASGFQHGWGLTFTRLAAGTYADGLAAALGRPLLALSIAGLVFCAVAGWRREAQGGRWVALAAMPLGLVAFQCLVPAGLDSRYLLPVLAPLVVLAAFGGMRLIGLATSGWRTLSGLAVAMAMLLMALPFATQTVRKPPTGMEEAARTFLAAEQNPMILVGGDAEAEGALVAAVAQHDAARRAFALRGTKMLAVTDWNAASYAPLYADAADVLAALDKVGVGFVAVDTSPASQAFTHNRQLLEAADRFPERLRPVGRYPRADGTGEARLYALTSNEARTPDPKTLPGRSGGS